MAILAPIQTLWATAVAAIGETARLVMTWRDTGGGTGVPVLSVHNSGMGQVASMDLTPGLIDQGAITTTSVHSRRGTTGIEIDGVAHRIDLGTLFGMDPGRGGPGPQSATRDSMTLWMDRSAFSGNALAAHRDGDLVFLSARHGAGITVFRADANGSLTSVSALADTAALALDGISAMTSLATAGGRYLIAASQANNAVVVMRVAPDGTLTPVQQVGTAELLPVALPSQVAAVTLNGQHFVILGSFGTSSLTVMRLTDEGSLVFVDHLIDSRETRFGGLTAMDIMEVDGQILVAVAGGDGGVSLFALLPSGRLLHIDTLVDGNDTALQNIQDLHFVMVGNRLELFALASGDGGVTRLVVDPARYGGGAAGITSTSATGTDGNDILTAPRGGVWVRGGAGDDILIGGTGRDTLEGGAGADIYMLQPDFDGRDVVLGFDPAQDRIDLSCYPMLRGVDGLTILPNSNGAILRIGSAEITIVAGRRLGVAELEASLLFNADRIMLPAGTATEGPPVSMGTPGNDVFDFTPFARIFDGGAGIDSIRYDIAPAGVTVDLEDSSRNAGEAAGHVLLSIEAVIGSAFADVILGTATGNTLTGGAGNDSIDGRGGNDWITPGAGNDTVDGGAGTDMVSFDDARARVEVDLTTGRATSGTETDTLRGIENVTGSIFGDLIIGDAGANLLRGMGDYDWFVGSDGNDTIDGGTGRDTISYAASTGGVTVDLGAGRGLAGQAEGDRYISIERATGSSFADIFYGSADEDEFRGLGGNDWFVGSFGRDRYDGGSGLDTVAYTQAPGGVEASLLLGRGSAGQAVRDLYTSIENLTGSSFADTLTGDHGANVLRGMAGNDSIYGNGGGDVLDGGGGHDTLDGGPGNDSLTGGAGNDLLIGGAGYDHAYYDGPMADYIIRGRVGYATVTSANGEGFDQLIGVEALVFSDGYFFL